MDVAPSSTKPGSDGKTTTATSMPAGLKATTTVKFAFAGLFNINRIGCGFSEQFRRDSFSAQRSGSKVPETMAVGRRILSPARPMIKFC